MSDSIFDLLKHKDITFAEFKAFIRYHMRLHLGIPGRADYDKWVASGRPSPPKERFGSRFG